MKVLITTILFALLGVNAMAQNDQVNLLLQSPDGKTVKLIWLPLGHTEITAVDIKRKEGLQDWVKLNRAPIEPGISMRKRLYLVESDKAEVTKLVNKMNELLKTNKLRETDNTFLPRLATDDNAAKELTKLVTQDYDLALMAGFGYVDHTVTKRNSYQYGIFVAGTNKLIASVKWNYGAIPDLNIIKETTSQSEAGKKGINLTWNADVNRMRAEYVAGFNIYRMGMQLNEVPIVATNNYDLSEFNWFDRNAPSNQMHQYSISASTILGLEGIIAPYLYNPADHAKEYKKADVTSVRSLGYYFKDGISIQWTFPKDYERYVKWVYVEKDNIPTGYKRVSPMMSPTTRSFTDTTGSPVNDYVRVRVVAVYNDRTAVNGNDRMYSYFPIPEPPVPLNVRAKGLQEERKYTVSLGWDQPMQGDTITNYYRVYVCDPMSKKLSVVADKVPVKQGTYQYVIQHGTAALYKFAVTATNKHGAESIMSDTIAVQVPSVELPTPAINQVIVASQNIQIKWDYPEIPDVKGFRLFQNQQVIATENELKKNIRDFVTAKLEQGIAYDFTLKAVSENGVISEVSVPAAVTVPKGR
jgi:hypothetical protein